MTDDQLNRPAGRGEAPTELPGTPAPKWDLVGPTVEDDVRRTILRYGAGAVKAAVKEATKLKRGRKKEPDWSDLRDVIKMDALDWLAGGDPFAARTNYAIAKEFAERNPGQSAVSTHQRIERKLSGRAGPYDRRWYVLVTAENISRKGWPYAAHIRALEALCDLSTGPSHWDFSLELARKTIADYEIREGKAPDACLSFEEIEQRGRKGIAALLSLGSNGGGGGGGGLFGLRTSTETALSSLIEKAVGGQKV